MRISLLTTPLTTYGFGLPGFYAAKSTRKQSIRTQKPRKARQITQKIRFLAFGTSMPQVQILSLRPNKDYYFDRMVVLIFCFMGLSGLFSVHFRKNRLTEQLKNAIADNFLRWRFFVAHNISLDLWVFVIFVGLSLDLWVFRYPYGVIVKLSLFPTCPSSNIC